MTEYVWIQAAYTFPSLYSIRIPGSSNSCARATPAPGPGTVRLALIKTACQVYGESFTQKMIYPVIRDVEVVIIPPNQIAITNQIIKMQKYSPVRKGYVESIGYREYCHTNGQLTIGMKVPIQKAKRIKELFSNISYWGQTNSLANCETVETVEHFNYKDCIQPLEKADQGKLRGLFSCFLSELRPNVTWDEVVNGKRHVLDLSLYVFPLEIREQRKGNMLLLRYSQGR